MADALVPHRPDLRALTLEELFRRAESFGAVTVFSDRKNRPPLAYRVQIEFDSIRGTTVEAKSEFNMTIEDAFLQAIDRAERIVEAYSNGAVS